MSDSLAEALDKLSTGGAPAYADETNYSDGYAVTQDGQLVEAADVPDDAGINEQVAQDYAESGETMSWDSGVYIDQGSGSIDAETSGSNNYLPIGTTDTGSSAGDGDQPWHTMGGGSAGGLALDDPAVMAALAAAVAVAAVYAAGSL